MGSTFSQPEWELGKNENSPLQVRKVSAENRKNPTGQERRYYKSKIHTGALYILSLNWSHGEGAERSEDNS